MSKKDNRLVYNSNYDSTIMRDIMKCNDLCWKYNKIKPTRRKAQKKILKKIFPKSGNSFCFNAPLWVDFGYKTTIGEGFFANHDLQILDMGGVTFGDRVMIAPGCIFSTVDHALDVGQRNEGFEIAYPIKVGNNVWFGSKVTVLGGVTIGDNTVIAAGSVVTKDIPSGVIAAGVPCKVLREITDEDRKDLEAECQKIREGKRI